MADEEPLGQEALVQLRQVLQKLEERKASGEGFPLDDVVALAALLPANGGLTIDLEATQQLGSPMVVVRLPPMSSAPTWWPMLSPREQEIAQFVAKGLRNKEIATALHISLATVKDHIHNIFSKTGMRNRAALAVAMGSTTASGGV